jgi:hypothetical protein
LGLESRGGLTLNADATAQGPLDAATTTVDGGRRGCLLTPLVIVIMAALFGALIWGMDAAMYPWAHPLLGKPTLAGEWSGTLRAAHGERSVLFGIYLDIRHDLWRRYRSTDFDGEVEICGPSGIETAGSISGRYDRWVLPGAAHFQLNFGSPARRIPIAAARPSLREPYLGVIDARLKGSWTGGTAVVSGAGSLAFVIDDGSKWQELSSASEPLTLPGTTLTGTLQRCTKADHAAACYAQ